MALEEPLDAPSHTALGWHHFRTIAAFSEHPACMLGPTPANTPLPSASAGAHVRKGNYPAEGSGLVPNRGTDP